MAEASVSVRSIIPEMKSYVLTERLGSGTYATVYKAFKKGRTVREVVAVKCIERQRLTRVSMENLLMEIEVMKNLDDHPHIVKLIDFEWDDHYIFLIMEFCNGGDLSTFIKSRTVLREYVARKFLRQLAVALQFLRSKGIAHMDLKPQNLLLSGGGGRRTVLKLGDFGMAQHLSPGDQAASFRGSPLYMAPEVLLCQPYDAKVDLWSVGVILYEALFGMAPFASKTLEELEEKVLDQKPIEIPGNPIVSDECRQLLVHLLQRDPGARISFTDFFNHPFIDLDHFPSQDSMEKARSLILQAVTKDQDGKLSSAVNSYCQALEYFLPALEYEEDQDKKRILRQKIQQYVERAESLKEVLRAKTPSKRQEQPPVRLLDEMKRENRHLRAALLKAALAEKMESQQDYRKALELYQESVSLLLPLIEEAPNREQKKLLKSEAHVYLNRAEEVQLLSKTPTPKYNRSEGTETSDSRCRVQ